MHAHGGHDAEGDTEHQRDAHGEHHQQQRGRQAVHDQREYRHVLAVRKPRSSVAI